jgi:polyribonucleotide nucleotidyltransferase
MSYVREGVMIGGKELTIETGRMAKQAGGSVVVRYGDTMVLVAATASARPRDLDFLPLTCEYQEKTSSAGKIPGGYFKREGRPTEVEILTCRLIDRPVRPLFPKGWRFDTQIIATVLSADRENPSDVLALTGASAATVLSDLVWDGPIAGVRVGRVGGEFLINPTFAQQAESDLNFVVACSREAIVMVEGSAKEVPEPIIIDALLFAHKEAQALIDLQEKLRAAVGKAKRAFTPPAKDEALHAKVYELGTEPLRAALAVRIKQERGAAVSAVHDDLKKQLCTAEGAPYVGREKDVDGAYSSLMKKVARGQTLDTGLRIDGRKTNDIRLVTGEVSVLPRVHGSALFTRGETQALVSTTLGTAQDVQRIDSLTGDVTKRFLLHYNFPPYSTGETKPMRGASRREIGHGNLAERAITAVLPPYEDFPYTVRIVSEILESNGSSSMASVCGGIMALMDAGVPVTSPVAGIAMGLMKEGDKVAVLSDILGDEDHLGDMDFKVCGTRKGITALQMDIKISGLSREILESALAQARDGRLHILDKMAEVISAPRDDMSPYAPRIYTIQVKPDRIRDIIGPGGKTIRAITEETGVAIDVEDDGTVSIASSDERSARKAMDIIKGLTAEPEIGGFYQGVVKRIAEFGAFVEIMPGTDGLVHISELAAERVKRVEDILKEGDELMVKVISIDRQGKIRLSRKEALGQTPEVVHNLRS